VRAVIQRVTSATVQVGGAEVGAIGGGLLVYLSVAPTDTPATAAACAKKLSTLRLFADEAGKMSRSVVDTVGEILVVSQFTLHATLDGTRPSFSRAASPEHAEPIYRAVQHELIARGVRVQTGQFGAHMIVRSTNDGPVTLLLAIDED
jgi:D-tyrosyl-tRNA(Tyr) deacylase